MSSFLIRILPQSLRICGELHCGRLLPTGQVSHAEVSRVASNNCSPSSHSGWFTGLSGKFLSARTARLLVLAGAERLDKELMIGQMQGKFQLEVLANVGHMVHEVSEHYS